MPTKWIRMHTESEFREHFADQTFVSDGLKFTIHDDGSMTGTIDGSQLTGNWYWDQEFFCRTAALNGVDLGLDCEIIERRGNQMRYVRDKGNGEASVVTILE